MRVVVPAVLPDSKADLDKKLALLAAIPAVSRIQIDVVDGQFASPASWPYSAAGELRRAVERHDLLPHLDRIEYEVDLMCFDALRAAEAWLALGASRLIFHAESTDDLPRFFAIARRRYGGVVSFGLALTSAGDPALIEPVLGNIEYVQFMGIARIGRQGQPFDGRVFEQVRVFRERHPDVPVQVDGGVSLVNARKLLGLGVANLVVGSAILRAHDPSAAIAALEMCQNHYE